MLRFWHAIFLAYPAVILLVGVHFAGPILIALAGLFYRQTAVLTNPIVDSNLKKSWIFLLLGFASFVLSGIFVGLWHGNNANYFEKFIPFIIFPAIAWLVRAGGWNAYNWFYSIAFGAIIAFLFAIYQIFILGIDRAFGATLSPIHFGNTTIVLGSICAIATLSFNKIKKNRKFLFPLLIAGALAGLFASLLSGSKGGWLSIFIVGLAITYWKTGQWKARHRLAVAFCVITLFSMLFLLMPSNIVKDRLTEGASGAVHWAKTGQVTDGSVSMRLQIWSYSLQMIVESPWIGRSTIENKSRWAALTTIEDQVGPYKTIPSGAHNELLGALRDGGIIGTAGYIAAYFGAWLAFWRMRNHPDSYIKTLSLIGMIVVLLYLEFGLSITVFELSIFRSVFVATSVILLSFISVRSFQLMKSRN